LYYVGAFDYAMDERGRVPLPPDYRDAFRNGVVLSQGSPDPCLRVYTTTAFDEQASEWTGESAMHEKGFDVRLATFSRTRIVELDKQNRILIPAQMREHAGITNRVVVACAGEFMTIWSPEGYAARMAQIDAGLRSTMESVAPQRA
jgi:MraZ protein